jgi:hypothetical protein
MNDQPPPRRPTPDEVLHALRHFAQFNSDEPFAWPGAEQIGATTTLKEFDLLRDSTGDLGDALNDFFGIADLEVRSETVRDGLQRKTVGELCEFLSARVTLAPLARFDVLDRRCEVASIFVTLKTNLAAAGLNVRDLAPSTPIARYARDYPNYCTLIRTAAQIAPARLPLSELGAAGWLLACGKLTGCGLFLAAIGLTAAGCESVLGAVSAVVLAALMLLFFTALASGYGYGWNRIPGVRTFRDLCKVLAGESTERSARTKGLVP